jgi:hypothetical protein
MKSEFSLSFDGGLASEGQLDFYDAAFCQEGFARFLLIAGHFAATGKIIHKAPFSEAEVRVHAPERGSFIITATVSVAGLAISAGVTAVVAHLLNRALPKHDSQMADIYREQKETNRLLRQQMGLEPKGWAQILEEEKLLPSHDEEIQTLRGITAPALSKTFRPLGRSAEHCLVSAGPASDPIRVVDEIMASAIIADEVDENFVSTTGVVNNFSQSNEAGYIWDDQCGRRIPFEYEGEKLPPGNDFSWSLYHQKPIAVYGRYVRWLDGSVKKILVTSSERISDSERFTY